MNYIKFIILTILSVFLFFCGGGDDRALKVGRPSQKTPLADIKSGEKTAPVLQITDIKFISPVDTMNDIEVLPVLSDKEAAPDLRFRWFINEREVEGENTPVLPADYLRENDWVYCRVIIDDALISSPEKKSQLVRVKGAVPIVNLTMVKDFTSPGVFRYRINASLAGKGEDEDVDDDQAEEETDKPARLRFELISPLEKGIILDQVTGEIVWDISREIIDELGDDIAIRFSVISPSGRRVNSSISLKLEESGTKAGDPSSVESPGKDIE